MAATAKKPGPARKKPAAKAPASHPEDHVDGCLCDIEVPEYMLTRDEDLPAAKGGVARR